MAAHDHHHENDSFYLDQLCLIGISGAFAAICVTLYLVRQNMLRAMFGPLDQTWFGWFVFVSGIILAVLVFFRALAVWRSVGNPALRGMGPEHDHGFEHHEAMHPDEPHHHHEHGVCDHGHEHGHHHHAEEGIQAAPSPAQAGAVPHTHTHDHGHDHGHGHDHDHDDHDHGWAPWRYAVLLVPVALFLLGLPNQGRAVKALENVDTTQEAMNVATFLALGPNPLLQLTPLAAATGGNNNETPIYLNGTLSSFSELKPDMKVFLKLARGNVIGVGVEEIRDKASAHGKSGLVPAVIKAVHPEDRSVTLELDRDGSKQTERVDLRRGRCTAWTSRRWKHWPPMRSSGKNGRARRSRSSVSTRRREIATSAWPGCASSAAGPTRCSSMCPFCRASRSAASRPTTGFR